MATAVKKKKKVGEAKAYAPKVMIICPAPKCGEAVRDPRGDIQWTLGSLPANVECQACGRVSRVARTIHPYG